MYPPRMHHRSGAAPTFRVRKGSWTEEEDTLLRRCIAVYGEGNWHQVPKRAGLNRCRKSCRLRWLNYLRPNIKRGRFSPDEVDCMVRLHKLLGNRWALIAGRLPGRTTNDVKNYWNTHFPKKRALKQKQSINPTAHATNRVATETIFATTTEIIKPQPRTFKKTSPWVQRSHSEAMLTPNEQNSTTSEQQPSLSTLFPENDKSSGPNTIRLASLPELMEKTDDDAPRPDSGSLSWSRSVSGLASDRASEGGDMVLGQTTGDLKNYRNTNQLLYKKTAPREKKSLNTTTLYTTRRSVPSTTFATTTEIIKPRPLTFSKTSPWKQKRDSNAVFPYDSEQNNTPLQEHQQQQQSRKLFHAQENSTGENTAWWESLLQLEQVMEMIDSNSHGPNSESAGSRSMSMSGLATTSSGEQEYMAQPNTIMQEDEVAVIEGRNEWEDFCLDVQFWEAMSGP